MNPRDLQVGKRYRIHIEDCCVTVLFSAILWEVDVDEGCYLMRAVFDNGVTLEKVLDDHGIAEEPPLVLPDVIALEGPRGRTPDGTPPGPINMGPPLRK